MKKFFRSGSGMNPVELVKTSPICNTGTGKQLENVSKKTFSFIALVMNRD
jgi:hypothetical protein